jgi:hypothetical protein
MRQEVVMGNEKRVAALVARSTKHGLAKRGRMSPEYAAWMAIKARCYNPACTRFPAYGGRGIVMCERWLHDPAAFYADMGPRPSSKHSIDRIDVNGNYEPGNCRWATMREQNNNRTNNRLIMFNGRMRTLQQISELTGISHPTLHYRLAAGWSVELATTVKPSSGNRVTSSVRLGVRVLPDGEG